MAHVDHAQRTIETKLVYFGPHGSGKTANLTYVYDKTRAPESPPFAPAEPDDTKYEIVPLSLGAIRGYTTKVQLVALSGHPSMAAHRFELLGGADGIVFVADARAELLQANHASLSELRAAWARHAFPAALPFVFQANKRDAPSSRPATDLAAALGASHVPAMDAVATSGVGVFDTLKIATKLILTELRRG